MFRKSQYFIIDCKSMCSAFAREGDVTFIILDDNILAFCSKGKHLLQSSKAVCYTKSLKIVVLEFYTETDLCIENFA
jgi:hypothetical protein